MYGGIEPMMEYSPMLILEVEEHKLVDLCIGMGLDEFAKA